MFEYTVILTTGEKIRFRDVAEAQEFFSTNPNAKQICLTESGQGFDP